MTGLEQWLLMKMRQKKNPPKGNKVWYYIIVSEPLSDVVSITNINAAHSGEITD